MPASRNYLIEGIDPSQSTCLSAQDLINLIRAAAPESDIGFVFKGTSGPNVNLYPEMERFLYLSTDGMLRFYKNGGWELVKAALALVPNSIPINILSPIDPWTSQSAASKVIRVNSAGTSFKFYYINDIIENLDVSHLRSATVDSALASIEGNNLWLSLRDLWLKISAQLQNNDIPVGKIAKGAATQVLTTNASGAVGWQYFNDAIPQRHIDWLKLKHETITPNPQGTPPVYSLDCASGVSFRVEAAADCTINMVGMLDGQSIQVFVVTNGNTISFTVPSGEGLTLRWPGGTMPDVSTTARFVASFSRFGSDICGTIVSNF